MNIGDSVYCIRDLTFLTIDGERSVIESGHALIIKNILGDNYILERFGKMFVLTEDEIRIKEK